MNMPLTSESDLETDNTMETIKQPMTSTQCTTISTSKKKTQEYQSTNGPAVDQGHVTPYSAQTPPCPLKKKKSGGKYWNRRQAKKTSLNWSDYLIQRNTSSTTTGSSPLLSPTLNPCLHMNRNFWNSILSPKN